MYITYASFHIIDFDISRSLEKRFGPTLPHWPSWSRVVCQGFLLFGVLLFCVLCFASHLIGHPWDEQGGYNSYFNSS